MSEYCTCGTLIINSKCTNKYCNSTESYKWIINGQELIFKSKITYVEAIELAKDKANLVRVHKPPSNLGVKEFVNRQEW